MSNITLAMAKKAVEQAINEQGEDYVYSNGGRTSNMADCLYVHDDGPGCIVGNVLHRLGVPLEDMRPFEGTLADRLFPCLDGFTIDHSAAEYLSELQVLQDSGISWGEAALRTGKIY